MSTSIYFDYAAATPLAPEARSAMEPYFSEKFYNTSALYLSAKEVARDVAAARAAIASWFGTRPTEVVFTAGGTEANNLAIQGVMDQYPEANIIVSAIEHEAVLQPAEKYPHKIAPVNSQGLIDLDQLGQLIDEQTALVSIMYANNEIGTIQPIRAVAQMIARIRDERKKAGNNTPLYLHTDACQAANYLDLHVSRLGVDLMTTNAGKIYGPKQCGALFVRAGISLNPQILGGGQERGIRSGTENVANIVGFAAALDLVQSTRENEIQRLKSLQNLFFDLLEQKLPSAIINGSRKTRLPNNIHVTFPGVDNERLMMSLDERGILCATGSACSASSDEPSHVLTAIGLSDADAQSSLRFSLGRGTTEADIHRVIDELIAVIG
ncbi:MAG: cysteine desulfurase [Candidatus Saccharibacteria bacterium]|nr:cysteine desulfurase [Candidatus Saccharibacteria bacterium]